MRNVIVAMAVKDEIDSIEELLSQLTEYKVVVIDGGSTDGTIDFLRKWKYTSLFNDALTLQGVTISRAYQAALRIAYHRHCNSSNVDAIVQMDAGLTHNPRDIKGMLNKHEHLGNHESRLIIGARFIGVHANGPRAVISKGAAVLMRPFLDMYGLPLRDVTSGFRLWTPDVLGKVVHTRGFPHSKHFAFQLESLYLARKYAYINEYPIEYKLTNSSFKPAMVLEALWTVASLKRWYG